MPWEIVEGKGKFCVHKKGETDPLKCYDNKKEAEEYMAALYANAGNETAKAGKINFRTAKAITDAPNLRGDNNQNCSNCKFFKYMPSPMEMSSWEGICNKFEFLTGGKWVCDSWETVPMQPIEVAIVSGSEMPAKASIGMYLFPDIFIPQTTIKAIEGSDWNMDILGIPFGGPIKGKDLQGEYFSEKTDVYMDALKSATVPMFYYHGLTPDRKHLQEKPVLIGLAKYDHTDSQGHWFKGVLDKTVEFAARVWKAAKEGLAKASSGSINHLVRIAKNGEIIVWPVAELSLLDATEGRMAINSYAVALPALKANYQDAGLELPTIVDQTEGHAGNAGKASERAEVKSRSYQFIRRRAIDILLDE